MKLQVGIEDMVGPHAEMGVDIVGTQYRSGGHGVGHRGEVVTLPLVVASPNGGGICLLGQRGPGENCLDNLVDIDGV